MTALATVRDLTSIRSKQAGTLEHDNWLILQSGTVHHSGAEAIVCRRQWMESGLLFPFFLTVGESHSRIVSHILNFKKR